MRQPNPSLIRLGVLVIVLQICNNKELVKDVSIVIFTANWQMIM